MVALFVRRFSFHFFSRFPTFLLLSAELLIMPTFLQACYFAERRVSQKVAFLSTPKSVKRTLADGAGRFRCLWLGMYRIFASVPNSVFVFGRIVSSERMRISSLYMYIVQLVTYTADFTQSCQLLSLKPHYYGRRMKGTGSSLDSMQIAGMAVMGYGQNGDKPKRLYYRSKVNL